VGDLSGYSRAISRPLATTQLRMNAWRTLPVVLRIPATNPIYGPFQKLISQGEFTEGFTILKVGVLARWIELQQRETLSKAQAKRLSLSVDEMGWRIAPDPAIGGGAFFWEQEAALFKSSGGAPSANLVTLSRHLYLTAIVSSDGKAEDQLEIFRRVISD
jgi:hypothetical protein